MNLPPPIPWSVEVRSSGRSGSVEYREEAGALSLYWEFGGEDAVACIWTGDVPKWMAQYPWAVGHRRQILERVAEEVVRQKAPNCRAEIDERDGCIYTAAHHKPSKVKEV